MYQYKKKVIKKYHFWINNFVGFSNLLEIKELTLFLKIGIVIENSKQTKLVRSSVSDTDFRN